MEVGYKSGVFYRYQKRLIQRITKSSQQIEVFSKYFYTIGVTHFVVENEYIDGDYLKDYKNLYSTFFREESRVTKRIHLFKIPEELWESVKGKEIFDFVEIDQFNNLTNSVKDLNDYYCGFSVMRPLGKKSISKTCIRTYGDDLSKDRKYMALGNFYANLYGVPLHIKTMPFQEQDGNVSVCATIALWSALQTTSQKFNHYLPAPSEVTNLALSESSYAKKFPNEGLTINQICVAISKVGLVPIVIDQIRSHRYLKSLIFAYLHANIPLIIGISLYDMGEDGHILKNTISYHAITVNGYSFKQDPNTEKPYQEALLNLSGGKDVRLYSSKMTRFYAHDDQLCPFAKMKFIDKIVGGSFMPISTSWHSKSGKGLNKVAKIEAVVVPVEENIRITYANIEDKVYLTEEIIRKTLNTIEEKLGEVEWKIYIIELNSFRKKILHSSSIGNEQKKKILMKKLPKYLWIAKLYSVDEDNSLTKLSTYIFDTTSNVFDKILLADISYSETFKHISYSLYGKI